MSYIIRNQFGAFCSVCQSALSTEEDDWDECDVCGGEGIGHERDDWDELAPSPVSRNGEVRS